MQIFHFYYDSLNRHHVYEQEAIEAFFDPYAVDIDIKSSASLLLGKTMAGRLLEIGYRENQDASIYIFHAMDARKNQRVLYQRRSL